MARSLWFNVDSYFRVVSVSLECMVCGCMCAWTHVYPCVRVCVARRSQWRLTFSVAVLEFSCWTPLLRLFASDSCWVPCVISSRFPLRALSLEHGFLHFLFLVSGLFASLLPKGSMELLKGPFELFIQWMKSSVQRVTGTAVLPTGPWCSIAGPWLTQLASAASNLRSRVGGRCVPASVTFSAPLYLAF